MDVTGRDLGLRRLSVITRWSVGAAVVLSGALSALVAHARPGHAAKASSIGSVSTSPTTAPAAGDNVLQPPLSGAPSAGSGGGLVTSGAS